MAIKIESEASCRAAYLNRHCDGNTMNITNQEMKQIIERWGDKRFEWQEARNSTVDENPYEFDDAEFESIREDSYNETKDKYGDNVNVATEKARSGTDIATTAGAAGALLAGSSKAIGGITVFKDATQAVADVSAGVEGATASMGEKMGAATKLGDIMTAISCVLTFITGLSAKTNKANKEEIDAVNQLNEEMSSHMATAENQNMYLEELRETVETKSDEATEQNEESNEEIEGLTTEHNAFANTYQSLQSKIDSGLTLSESEADLYNGIRESMQTTGEKIDTKSKEATATAQASFAEIEGFTTEYDSIATNIADVKGVTDYAESIDEATQKNCKKQSIVYTVGAATGALAALKAFGNVAKNIAVWPLAIIWGALGALATTGTVFLGMAAKEQKDFSQQAATEVQARAVTQDINTKAETTFEADSESYNDTKAVIQTLEIYEPEELVKASEEAYVAPTKQEEKPAQNTPVVTNNNPATPQNNNDDDNIKKNITNYGLFE